MGRNKAIRNKARQGRQPPASTSHEGEEETKDEDAHRRSKLEDRPRGKLHTFQKAKLAFEQIKRDKYEKRKNREANADARDKAVAARKTDNKMRNKSMKKKNRRGQPKLGEQMKYILSKIERSAAR